MKKYIYKIENLVNHKLYIGQSVDPKKRFRQHCHNRKDEKSLISLAILKYGKENFKMTIIEGPIDNYNEREKYWIKYYHTWIKDEQYNGGYNLAPGGEEPPILKGTDNYYTTHTVEQVIFAKRLLKETDVPLEAIADACGYADRGSIMRINVGVMWNDPEEEYPLRVLPLSKQATEKRWQMIADLLYNTELSQKQISEVCNCKRSCVTMINIGKNGKEYNNGKYSYPIRKEKYSAKQRFQRAEAVAKDLFETDLTYDALCEKHDCGKTFLSQINQGKNYKFDKYTYPIRK